MGLLLMVWVCGGWNVLYCGGNYVLWGFGGGGFVILYFMCDELGFEGFVFVFLFKDEFFWKIKWRELVVEFEIFCVEVGCLLEGSVCFLFGYSWFLWLLECVFWRRLIIFF